MPPLHGPRGVIDLGALPGALLFGDPRDVGEDYVEAYVPVAMLGPV